MALKDLQIRALKATDRIYKKADQGGLYIEVHPSGSKLWRFKYGYLGKDKRLALGRYPEVSLAEARQKRDEAKQKLRDGIDPLSRQVLAYLAELHPLTGPDGYVFPAFHTSRRPLSENPVNQVFRRLGYAVGEVTAHGLRTTASTLLNESGKWSADAIERSLAHADKDDPDSIRSVINKSGYALAPARAAERPHPHFLAWHREHRFKQ